MTLTLSGRILLPALLLFAATSHALGAGEAPSQRLSDLADGETRTYGCGDHQVTASRAGDLVTLAIPEEGGRSRTLTIDLSRGDGTIASIESDAADGRRKQRLVVVKRRLGEGGAAEELVSASAWPGGEPRVVVLDESGETVSPSRHEIEPLFETSDPRAPSMVTVARCPEGDTAMRIAPGDTTAYLCPKHRLVLGPGAAGTLEPFVAVTERGSAPASFETRTMGGGEHRYTGKPLSLDF